MARATAESKQSRVERKIREEARNRCVWEITELALQAETSARSAKEPTTALLLRSDALTLRKAVSRLQVISLDRDDLGVPF